MSNKFSLLCKKNNCRPWGSHLPTALQDAKKPDSGVSSPPFWVVTSTATTRQCAVFPYSAGTAKNFFANWSGLLPFSNRFRNFFPLRQAVFWSLWERELIPEGMPHLTPRKQRRSRRVIALCCFAAAACAVCVHRISFMTRGCVFFTHRALNASFSCFGNIASHITDSLAIGHPAHPAAPARRFPVCAQPARHAAILQSDAACPPFRRVSRRLHFRPHNGMSRLRNPAC